MKTVQLDKVSCKDYKPRKGSNEPEPKASPIAKMAKIHPLTALGLLGVALFGAILRYGFPPSEGWLRFIGAMILFAGMAFAVVLADRHTRKN